jgi:hypothetical protein
MYPFSLSVWSQFVLAKKIPKGEFVGYLVISCILAKQIFKQDVV